MLFRFSLYGFLKNQRYYEPFLVLAFLSKGQDFFYIGLLIGVREVARAAMEIPSGAIADIYGRKKCMLLSLSCYIVSFLFFALGGSFIPFLAAMFIFGLADAFRSGTHKALIISWLEQNGRKDEQIRFYGFTRSWSQVGAALSALIGAAWVFYTGSYSDIFWFSIIPYAINIINLASYPSSLDSKHKTGLRQVGLHLLSSASRFFKEKKMRRLIFESMGFSGVYEIVKEYLQPLLKFAALSLPVFLALDNVKRTAILVACIYTLLYLLSGFASYFSHNFTLLFGGRENAALNLWRISFVAYLTLFPFLYFNMLLPSIAIFVFLALLQNIWRPLQVGRYNAEVSVASVATVLSVESQAKSFAAIVLAPLIGFFVDQLRAYGAGQGREFWPLAVLGVATGFLVIIFSERRKEIKGP
jgi:MFS family permease